MIASTFIFNIGHIIFILECNMNGTNKSYMFEHNGSATVLVVHMLFGHHTCCTCGWAAVTFVTRSMLTSMTRMLKLMMSMVTRMITMVKPMMIYEENQNTLDLNTYPLMQPKSGQVRSVQGR